MDENTCPLIVFGPSATKADMLRMRAAGWDRPQGANFTPCIAVAYEQVRRFRGIYSPLYVMPWLETPQPNLFWCVASAGGMAIVESRMIFGSFGIELHLEALRLQRTALDHARGAAKRARAVYSDTPGNSAGSGERTWSAKH